MSKIKRSGGLEIEVCPEWNKRNKALLALPWSYTFDDLAHAILQALGWDCDHLYRFCLVRGGTTFNQQIQRSLKIQGPELDAWDDDDLYTEIPLAELFSELSPKAVMYFHFDFGDDHFFRIVVKKHHDGISEGSRIKPFPASIAQYPEYDEGEGGDD